MNPAIIDQFKGNKVIVIGDVMLDKYLTGKIDRISPEAPVPIVSLKDRESRLGGAANVTLSLKALEAEPVLFSVVGADENGKRIRELLESNNISADHLQTSSHRKTTVKSRILASNQQILRVDEEDTHPLLAPEEKGLVSSISNYINENKVTVIIFQDYNKGVLTSTLIKAIIDLAKNNHIPTVVDPKRDNFWEFKGVTCFKPNFKEIKDALNIVIAPTQEELDRVHKALHKKLGNHISLITLSEHGVYFGSEGSSHLMATKSRKIADVCGAGDAVVAIIALCVANQIDPLNICQLANMVGGQVCEQVGVVPIEKMALCREISIENA